MGIQKAQAARAILGWARKTITIKITVGGFALFGGKTLKQVMEAGAEGDGFSAVRPEPGETAAILFTSGSTGPPKGVVYTHEIFSAQVEYIRRLYGIEAGEIDLPTFPLFALFDPALGMTAILPEMDATRPARVDPTKIIDAIETFGVTNMFGSPALINRVGRYGKAHGVKLPSIRRVISAGAPVPAAVLERFVALLTPGAQVFTPYGATECLPVSSIGSHEILGETRQQTEIGKGVCVGKPVPGLTVHIIKISDVPIFDWSDSLEVDRGEIGEIVVKGPNATRSYFNRPQATDLAKIPDLMVGGFYHRMGDVGYLDERGRIWFCGRKSHRVITKQGTLFTITCEGVFNTLPGVYRTALVGVRRKGDMEPVLCVELEADTRGADRDQIREQLLELGAKFPHTQTIRTILFHPAFPVDIRHNAKIFREKLAWWAEAQTT